MSQLPHELAADFPEHAERILTLRESDTHFAKLMADYEAVNERVHKAETYIEPMSEDAETVLRKERALLKDELYRLLTAAV